MEIPVEEVREALRCLYDGVALAQTLLVGRFPEVLAAPDQPSRAQRLRSILLDAIELLQPSRPASFRSPATRSYEVLAQHFLEGMPLAQIAEEMHISERQAYRDLSRAEEGLTELLCSYPWPSAQAAGRPQVQASQLLDDELLSISLQPVQVDVTAMLRSAVQTVTPLAREWGVDVNCDLADEATPALAKQALLRQTLVQMMSVAIRNSADRSVAVSCRGEAQVVTVQTQFHPQPGHAVAELFSDVRRLAQAQQLGWEVTTRLDGSAVASLALPTSQPHLVLVVEDNKGAIELYRRYLVSAPGWELIEVPDPRVTFEMAKNLRPTVIILDILMPQQDGWSVLQLLRAQPETAHIPILVCSVFDELDLAAALGASVYLKKPVSQFQLLAGLHSCLGR